MPLRKHYYNSLRAGIMAFISVMIFASVRAQEDAPSSLPIPLDVAITATISAEAFFDHWLINVQAGDILQVTMTGTDGLAPLVGVVTPGRTLDASSSAGAVNGSVTVTYSVPQDGGYIIVATRAGSEIGTTVGGYSLLVRNLNPQPTATPDYTIFLPPSVPCGETTAMPIFSVSVLREAFDSVAYSIRVYGFDGFRPALLITLNDMQTCITTPADALGDSVIFPGETAITLGADDLATTAQAVIDEDSQLIAIEIAIASLDPIPSGRFVAVIGGFRLEPAHDSDPISGRINPIAGTQGISALLALIGINNRLDPALLIGAGRCDDAGTRTCPDFPSLMGAGVRLNNGVALVGDRFDAGVRFTSAYRTDVQAVSFGGTTRGEYGIVIFSETTPLS